MEKDRIWIISVSYMLPVIFCFLSGKWFPGIGRQHVRGMDTAETLLLVWTAWFGFTVSAGMFIVFLDKNKWIRSFKKSVHYHTVLMTFSLAALTLLAGAVYAVSVVLLDVWNQGLFYILVYFLFSSFFLLAFCFSFLLFMVYQSV